MRRRIVEKTKEEKWKEELNDKKKNDGKKNSRKTKKNDGKTNKEWIEDKNVGQTKAGKMERRME